MSAEQMTELDADILAAFAALDATVPEGYFDDFETRLQARIEETDMTDISDPTAARTDDQELADIRALAAKTRERVSLRMSAVKAPEEPLISSVSLALKAISLPEPGKDFKFFAIDDTPKKATAAAAAASEERDGGLPVWIYAGISAVAAAAIMFFVLRGTGKKPEQTGTQVAVNQTVPAAGDPALGATPRGSNPAMAEMAKPGAPASALGQNPGATSAAKASADGAAATGAMTIPEASGMDPSAPADTVANKAAGTDDSVGSAASQGNAASAAPGSARRSKKSARADKKRRAVEKKSADEKPADKKAAPAKKKKKKPDTLEDLLSEASGVKEGKGKDKKKKPEAKAAPPSRTKIDSSEVRKAMNGLSGKTRACYEKYQQIGMVLIRFSVAPSGKVTSSKASGKFKGTDTGKCVAAAVKRVKFDPFNGAPASFTWPFQLTQ